MSLPRIVALCGKKRCGKDTIAEYLNAKYGYKNVKFAAPLKDAVQALFGFTYDQVENTKDDIDPFWGITPRNAMQFIGVEVAQIQFQGLIPDIGRGFFVKSLLAKYKQENIVISDMRFLHEYKAIKEIPGSLIIKIHRPNVDDGDEHISETELNIIAADYTVENNGTITQLIDQVDKIMYVSSSLK